jgi:polyhydroxybutyrate depolymerase
MRSWTRVGLALVGLLAAAPAPGLEAGQYLDRVLLFDGVERLYDLRVPAGYDGTTPIPLVVDMHGLGSNQGQQRGLSGMAALADVEGFAVVWPNGEHSSWNAGWCCGQAVVQDVHDVAFLRTLVEAVASEVAVDRARVYATGLSNGGAMTQRLACEAADVFAAAVAMAFPIGLSPISSCAPSRPIAVLTVQAPTDELVPYEGGGPFPSAAESFAQWRANDVCGDGVPEEQVVQGESHCEVDTSCGAGVEVGLCTVASTGLFGGHIVYLNDDFDLAVLAWEFLSRFSLPAAPPPLPVPVAGSKLTLKDAAADATRRKLALSLRDDALAPGPAFDPTTDGAALQVYNSNGSGEELCLALPAAGWKRKGQGFAYKDAKQLAGPCSAAKVAPGKLEVSCDGKRVPLAYTLDEPSQGSVSARFGSGNATFCARFGGTVQKDESTSLEAKAAFQAKAAAAPAACQALASPCPE